MGTDGYLSQKIGAEGRSPGEFVYMSGMDYNGSHIFVKDLERVQIFTEKFEYVGSFFNLNTTMQYRFSVSPDYIFLECVGIDWLVCPHSTSPPYAWIESIKLLPVLDLPNQSGENGNLVTVPPEGDLIAVAYMGFPYIFIYDDQFRHLRTIRFEGRQVHKFNPVAAPPDDAPVGMKSGTRSFMTTIKFLNSRYLLAESEATYIIDLSENDHVIARKINFRPTSNLKNITPGDFFLHGDHLYVSSPWEEYVYGYSFELK